jgi:hypothetical protein
MLLRSSNLLSLLLEFLDLILRAFPALVAIRLDLCLRISIYPISNTHVK